MAGRDGRSAWAVQQPRKHVCLRGFLFFSVNLIRLETGSGVLWACDRPGDFPGES